MKFIRSIYKFFCILLCSLFFLYLIIPSPDFPEPPLDSIQSIEGGDIESPLRRAYFTDYSRDEILNFYQTQFSKSSFLGIPLLTYRLNYPPEEAQTLIRDQTRSTFLEEIVHPLKESIFINGFKAKYAKDDIWYKGQHFSEKITIKYIPGNRVLSVIVGVFIVVSIKLLINSWGYILGDFIKNVRKS